ncbi:MAG: hypothetical protein ACYDAQ_03540 [Mycobacteriales bacterium]
MRDRGRLRRLRRARSLPLALAVAAGLAAAGCGSTVAIGGGVGSGSLGPGTVAAGTPTRTGTARIGTAGTGTAVGSAATSQGTSSPGAGAGSTASGAQSAAGTARPAVTGRAPIPIGIVYVANEEAYLAAFGSNSNTGDPSIMARAAVAWTNAHGGIAGHVVAPVYEAFSATSTQTYAQQGQAICAGLTQDHHVVAAIVAGINAPPSDLDDCLVSHGVTVFDSGEYLDDVHGLAALPQLFKLPEINASRLSRIYVDDLVRRGFFPPAAKVGVLLYDFPDTKRALAEDLAPELHRFGLRVDDQAVVTFPDNNSQIGQTVTQIQSAELNFRAAGVTNVLFLAPAGGAYFFMTDAEEQHAAFRYGLTSVDEPGALLEPMAPKDQLAASTTLGYWPVLDVDTAQQPTANPNTRLCNAILAGAGQPSTGAAAISAYGYCDGLFLLRLAISSSTGAISGPVIAYAVEKLGTRYTSAYSFATELTSTQHDGAAAYRDITFDATGCGCFRYTSGIRSAG